MVSTSTIPDKPPKSHFFLISQQGYSANRSSLHDRNLTPKAHVQPEAWHPGASGDEDTRGKLPKNSMDFHSLSLFNVSSLFPMFDIYLWGILSSSSNLFEIAAIKKKQLPGKIHGKFCAPCSIHRIETINRSAGFFAPFKISYKAAMSCNRNWEIVMFSIGKWRKIN